jgi:hypothetical protein
MWVGLPQISSAACNIGSVVSGHPAVISGLAIVTYALVSTVTRYGLSRTQTCVTRLGSFLSIMTAHGGGPLKYTPPSALFQDALHVSMGILMTHKSTCVLSVFSVSSFWRPCVLWLTRNSTSSTRCLMVSSNSD